MTRQPKFHLHQGEALDALAAEYDDLIPDDATFEEITDRCGMMFSACLAIVLDPETPPDCLGRKELAPIIVAGIDLADERTQEDVLEYLHNRVYMRRIGETGGDA